MSYWKQILLITTLVIGVFSSFASISVYSAAKTALYKKIDNDLKLRADEVLDNFNKTPGTGVNKSLLPKQNFSTTAGLLRIINQQGEAIGENTEDFIPINLPIRRVLNGEIQSTWTTVRVKDQQVRIYVTKLPKADKGALVQAGRSVNSFLKLLDNLKDRLIRICVFTTLLGAFAALFVVFLVRRPLKKLGETMKEIQATHDLSKRVQTTGNDEVAKLGQTFNKMLHELSASNQKQNQFVADASHELRTPTAVLRTNLEMLVEEELSEEQKKSLLQKSFEGSRQLSDLINDLLALSREEQISLEKVDLEKIIDECIVNAQRNFPDVTFEKTVLNSQPVFGKPEMLSIVFNNLLQNAAQWTLQKNPRVDITIKGNLVRVRDYGPGVCEKNRELVFERFYRDVDRRGKKGNGLGLSLSRHMMQECKGSLFVEDTNGFGATFVAKAMPFEEIKK